MKKLHEFIPNQHRSDWGGIIASGLCLLHCLATPVLLVLWQENHQALGFWHLAELGFFGLAVWAVSRSAGQAPPYLKALFFLGLGALGVSIMLELFNPHGVPWFSYLGGALLITAHLINLRRCRHCAF